VRMCLCLCVCMHEHASESCVHVCSHLRVLWTGGPMCWSISLLPLLWLHFRDLKPLFTTCSWPQLMSRDLVGTGGGGRGQGTSPSSLSCAAPPGRCTLCPFCKTAPTLGSGEPLDPALQPWAPAADLRSPLEPWEVFLSLVCKLAGLSPD
jgi:hypothetical protein